MPYRKQQFVNNDVYHIILRGIDDNLIFKNKNDYYRGVFSIYEFNTVKPITIRFQRKARSKIKQKIKELNRGPSSVKDERDRLIDLLAFCFMPNHIHLLIRQIKGEGIIKFMRKLGTGYGGYFNRKYNRKGYVFQNRFSAVHIKSNSQLKTVFVYIHSNPISCIEPKWKEKGIKNPRKVIKFLEEYKWSSYSDYVSKNNFPSVTEREFILRVMGGKRICKKFVENWVKYKGKFKS